MRKIATKKGFVKRVVHNVKVGQYVGKGGAWGGGQTPVIFGSKNWSGMLSLSRKSLTIDIKGKGGLPPQHQKQLENEGH
jgi:hypothetical protein